MSDTIKCKIKEEILKCNVVNEVLKVYISGLLGAQGPTGPTGAQGPTGPSDHSQLTNLEYAFSGHTGFQKKLNYVAEYQAYEIE